MAEWIVKGDLLRYRINLDAAGVPNLERSALGGKDYPGAESMMRRAAQLAPHDVNIRRQLGAIVALNLVHNSQEVSRNL